MGEYIKGVLVNLKERAYRLLAKAKKRGVRNDLKEEALELERALIELQLSNKNRARASQRRFMKAWNSLESKYHSIHEKN